MSQTSTGIDFTATGTRPVANVGQLTEDNDGNVYQYVKAGEAIAQYAFVKIAPDGTFSATELDTTEIATGKCGLIGCAQVAIASGSYGWVVRKGAFTGLSSAAIAAGSPIFPTATAGKVDDTSGDFRIVGAFAVAAIGSATSGSFYAPLEMCSAGVA